MKKTLVYGLFLLLACAGRANASPRKAKSPAVKTVSHWDAKNALVVPFEYDAAKENSPAVWLRINGGKPRLFIVDTGFSLPFVLTNQAANEMKIRAVTKEIKISGVKYSVAFSKKIALRSTAPAGIAAKDAPLPVVSFASLHLAKNVLFITDGIKAISEDWQGTYSAPPAGIIGSGFLHQAYHAVQFDFVRRVITLYPKANPRLRIPGATTVSLRPTHDCYMISVPLGGKTQEMLIDTGNANKVFIPDPLAADFNTLDSNQAPQTALRFGGRQEVVECLLPKLRIGSFIEEDIEAVTGEDKDLRPLLGVNFLSRFRVTLDYAHHEMTLERASDYKKHLRLPSDGLPCGITHITSGLTAVGVAPRSPAAQSGLQNEDNILAINGVAITEQNWYKFSTILPAYKDDLVTLLVQHKNGKQETLRLTMPGHYDVLKLNPGKEIGVTLIDARDDGWLVEDMDAGSLAEKAGFQKGDVILACNGKSTVMVENTITAVDTFVPAGQSITYTIRRKGEEKPRDIVVRYRVNKK